MYHTQKCFESIASDITMSNLSNIPGGGGLPDRFRNVGEQIQAFFDFASLTTRALALQGLGVAAKHDRVKEAFADWEVLKDIAKEVKGKGEVSNDLTRWAAATALEAIGYSQQSLQHLEGGGFTEPLDRIRREIRDRKFIEINRIPRLNSRGETTAEYERHLEFWIYGPADELLNDRDRSLNYQDLVGDVISKLHGRGVYLGLMSPNSIVQGAALRQAGLIFKESAEIEAYLYGLLEEFLHDSSHETPLRIHAAEIINTATDVNRRLKTLSKLLLEDTNPKLHEVALRQSQSVFKLSAEIEDFIYGLLEKFFDNSNNEIAVRIYAAEIINTSTDVNRRLKTLSKLLLEETNPKFHEVGLRQAQQAFHHYAEDFIYGLLEKFLDNSNNEIALRINAAEIINTTTDLSRRLKTLSQLLLEKIELRNAAVRLLTPYKHDLTRVEPDADTILKALIFSYSLNTLQKSQLQDLTISQLETYFSSASQDHREISEIFTSAIAASESLARRYGRSSSILKHFLQNKQEEYLSPIESWLQLLREQISETEPEQRKVQYNQALINETIDLIREENSYNYMYSYYTDRRGKYIATYYSKEGDQFVSPFPIPKKLCILDQSIVLSSTSSYNYNQSCQIKRDLKSINVYLLKFAIEAKKQETVCRGLLSTHYLDYLLHFDELPDYKKSLFTILLILDTIILLSIVVIFFVNHQWSWFATLSIAINLGIMVKIHQRCFKNYQTKKKEFEKIIENIQSILYKLNTQWQE
ncbi:hypothetical protein [Microcoleus sp. PH2017_05_CCC_O_A]|uniref:hypothetical protein n=1 Tax=Microcoleus sp. PH2017_05_CCC_O_A TaxID=2798816 RepID=UPI001DE015A4|nr:hypothetical protein [Microcoleus sp. PH2017_05_CCC_O_A]MCC3437441.1 hypothetical protein [Microcoleus sp. PH2017_05_CCC_O_A]